MNLPKGRPRRPPDNCLKNKPENKKREKIRSEKRRTARNRKLEAPPVHQRERVVRVRIDLNASPKIGKKWVRFGYFSASQLEGSIWILLW